MVGQPCSHNVSSANISIADVNKSESNLSTLLTDDLFASRLQDESIPPELDGQSSANTDRDSMEQANLSIGNSEVDLSGFANEHSLELVRYA